MSEETIQQPEAEPEAEPEAQPEPEAEPEAQPEPEAEPEAQPEPEVIHVPIPDGTHQKPGEPGTLIKDGTEPAYGHCVHIDVHGQRVMLPNG